MAQLRRLFLRAPTGDDAAVATDPVPLDADEARYACQVLRLQDGAAVTALDGRGHVAEARLVWPQPRAQPQLLLLHPWRLCASLAHGDRLTLLVPLPKGERADWMVEKLTELGCYAVRFVTCARNASNGPQGDARKRLERLGRVALAAARQARHGRVPQLVPAPAALADALAEAKAQAWPHPPFVADVAPALLGWAEALGRPSKRGPPEAQRHHVLLVGPEGGLTPDELSLARSFGYTAVGLGPHVLRVETAALAAAAVVVVGQPGLARPKGD